MDLYEDSANKILAGNEARKESLSKYKKSYETLIETMTYFEERYRPKVLLPICPKLFMRGTLIHTNEIMVSLGCDYFVNCSTKDAIDIAKRRIKKSEEIMKDLETERDFLTRQVSFKKDQVMTECEQEIIEPYDEETEKKWREEHRKNLKDYRKQENLVLKDADDGDIMSRLEVLQLQEEIENMYVNEDSGKNSDDRNIEEKTSVDDEEEHESFHLKKGEFDRKEVEKRLADLQKNRITKCVTEEDVFRRLKELEEEEYLEDLLEKYSDEDPEDDSEPDTSESEVEERPLRVDSLNSKRRVSFADDTILEERKENTTVINFSHSSETSTPLDSTSDEIRSPTDLYKMFPKVNGPKPIIKNIHRVKDEVHKSISDSSSDDEPAPIEKRRVYIGNIQENVFDKESSTLEASADDPMTRPVSKFKAARLASKKK